MTVELDFDWTKPDEENQVDRLDRGRYAKFLTNYLSGYAESSYVMNLNAEWGAGKTWFLKRWQQTIQSHHPTAYIDAWQNDFSDDPLLTVISGVFDALEGLCVNAKATEYKKNALRKSGQFFKAFAKGVVQHQMDKHLGDSADLIRNGVDAVSDSAVTLVLQDHKQKLKLIEEFKEEIQSWLNLVSDESDHKKPMFVFIDELDRCRPTYAIELLETVKHLFDIPGLVFVIATNTDQLQHSIKAVYGQEFDAQRYLYRFFNRSFTLKKPDLLEFIQVQPVFDDYFSQALLSTCDGNVTVENRDILASNFAAISESFDFDLRTTLQWMDQLHACYSDEKNLNKYFWLATAILLAMKISSPDLFTQFTSKNSRFEYHKRPDLIDFDHQFFDKQPSSREILLKVKPIHLHGVRVTGRDMQQKFFRDQVNAGAYTARSAATIFEELHGAFRHRSDEDLAIYRTRLAQRAYDGNPAALEIAIHYCEQTHDARYQGYIDLVELASDLT
ncbi:KAP family P-loop NTPase fold protein [Thalassolituus alkanivorans]|uniref:KAP family P-loop NTPase fold protein n=1 Tax=Thalassolituus alkanivorans TaxID=2881055 RepID=UPI001E33EAA0|nr:P-loop NTPase fold protein [Thalassolituus alkanivorans]MCB2387085.1 KAP family NTPase [Thalassolituus alkanivorans]MCB2421469.1 KAP family NTPase [Thalassolituus alkanivorans]